MQFKIIFAIFLGVLATISANIQHPENKGIIGLIGNFMGAFIGFYFIFYVIEGVWKLIKKIARRT